MWLRGEIPGGEMHSPAFGWNLELALGEDLIFLGEFERICLLLTMSSSEIFILSCINFQHYQASDRNQASSSLLPAW